MSTPVLHVEHVTMQFGGIVAVSDLSMDVYDREISLAGLAKRLTRKSVKGGKQA